MFKLETLPIIFQRREGELWKPYESVVTQVALESRLRALSHDPNESRIVNITNKKGKTYEVHLKAAEGEMGWQKNPRKSAYRPVRWGTKEELDEMDRQAMAMAMGVPPATSNQPSTTSDPNKTSPTSFSRSR